MLRGIKQRAERLRVRRSRHTAGDTAGVAAVLRAADVRRPRARPSARGCSRRRRTCRRRPSCRRARSGGSRTTVGSSRPLATSFISCGMVKVSTSPVVIVTSRIHSFSRCSVAGLPCTPMFATRPPGRIELGRQLERLRHADRLERDVGAEPVGELHDPRDGVLAAVVDRRVGAEALRRSRAGCRRGRSRRCAPACRAARSGSPPARSARRRRSRRRRPGATMPLSTPTS